MHGTFFSDFPGFHDFQSLWERCNSFLGTVHNLKRVVSQIQRSKMLTNAKSKGSTAMAIFHPFGKCSNILNTSYLPKKPKQTVQIQKQSDLGLHCLPLGQAFCELQP